MFTKDKPGSPSEILEHHGIKGMKWGVRKAQVTTAVGSHVPHLTDQQKSTAKKVAIGAGVATVAVGSAFVAYKLHQSGIKPVHYLNDGSESTFRVGSSVGSSKISGLNPNTVSIGKRHVQTLYTKWVDVQLHPIVPSAIGAALDLVK